MAVPPDMAIEIIVIEQEEDVASNVDTGYDSDSDVDDVCSFPEHRCYDPHLPRTWRDLGYEEMDWWDRQAAVYRGEIHAARQVGDAVTVARFTQRLRVANEMMRRLMDEQIRRELRLRLDGSAMAMYYSDDSTDSDTDQEDCEDGVADRKYRRLEHDEGRDDPRH